MNSITPLVASLLTIHARVASGKPIFTATAKPAVTTIHGMRFVSHPSAGKVPWKR